MIEFKGEEYEWFQEVMCGIPGGPAVGPFELVGLRGGGFALVLDNDGRVRAYPCIKATDAEPRLIPFTQETFPKCTVYVRSNSDAFKMEFMVSGIGNKTVIVNGTYVEYEALLESWEISIDNRHTYQAAGY